MKTGFRIAAAIAVMLLLVSCGGKSSKNSGVKFQPKERTSSLTDEERQAAIDRKRAELSPVSAEDLLYKHDVKFSIIRPLEKDDITPAVSEFLCMKMLEIASQNGISGIGTTPNFALGVEILPGKRVATGTAPQKMLTEYSLAFKVINTVTGDVYATCNQDVSGAGLSFEEATMNAMREVRNTPQMQKMLHDASDQIVSWYDSNVSTIRNQIDKAVADGDFAFASALLSSIPSQAKEAYKMVGEKQKEVYDKMLHKQASDMLGEMEALLASSNDEFNPAVGAYLSLIPTDTPEYKIAKATYSVYEKKCQARRAALEAKAERDEAAARELEKIKMLYDNQKDLAEIEADKVKSRYAAQAAAAQVQARPRGLFGALGYAVYGVADRVFRATDAIGGMLKEAVEE